MQPKGLQWGPAKQRRVLWQRRTSSRYTECIINHLLVIQASTISAQQRQKAGSWLAAGGKLDVLSLGGWLQVLGVTETASDQDIMQAYNSKVEVSRHQPVSSSWLCTSSDRMTACVGLRRAASGVQGICSAWCGPHSRCTTWQQPLPVRVLLAQACGL